MPELAGKCPVTDCYYEHCSVCCTRNVKLFSGHHAWDQRVPAHTMFLGGVVYMRVGG
jgi:hypothetical protein